MPDDIVWLNQWRTYAILLNRGAYFSQVKIIRKGQEVLLDVENDEYEFWEDHAIDFEHGDL